MTATLDDALAALRQADPQTCHRITTAVLRDRPHDAAGLALRGLSTPPDEAALVLPLLLSACRKAPADASNWFVLAREYERAGRFPDAAAAYRRAIALDPAHSEALLRGTEMLRVTEHFEETIPLARRLQRLFPDHAAGYAHEAIALQHLDRPDEADALFDAAVARSTDPALLHWEHHFSLLRRGRFGEAWDRYERRFDCGEANGVDDMAFDLPRWDGAPDRHVLVTGEQGIGDQLMFASALPDLLATAARVSLAVAPTLVDLFRASFPAAHVYPIVWKRSAQACAELAAEIGRDRPIDGTLPLGSLMARFRRDRDSFPGTPYLHASEVARAHWRRARPRRGATTRLSVGLCWACNPAMHRFSQARRAAHRTMPLAELARLTAIPGVEATAITDVPLAQFGVADPAAIGIEDVSADLISIDRTAALLEGIDLLITVDTGVAHLAGALGVPVWILLHKAGDPRWGMHGTPRSWWYRSAELFWQDAAGDWGELIDRVAARLHVEAQRRGTRAA